MDLDELRQFYYKSDVWQRTWFRGRRVLKAPTDLHAYHEVIWDTQPDLLVECGTFEGGSAVFFAEQLSALRVITIDKDAKNLVHPRITQFVGSSVDPDLVAAVHDEAAGKRVMVVLDSDHSAEHVAKEIEAYHSIVTAGNYLVVEDTFLHVYEGEPVDLGAVVDEFLSAHPEFERDKEPERFHLTLNPGGWLRRNAE